MPTANELRTRQSQASVNALSAAELADYLTALPDWAVSNGKLTRSFSFSDYYHTLAFVNAVAYVAHAEDHHPELLVGYNRCEVRFDTHSVNHGAGGLSANDFICAAKLDALARQAPG